MIAADPRGTLDYAARHYPGYDRGDLECGARRQPPCIDIRSLTQTVYDRWPSLQSLELVPSDAQPPANVFAFDLLAAELERPDREAPINHPIS